MKVALNKIERTNLANFATNLENLFCSNVDCGSFSNCRSCPLVEFRDQLKEFADNIMDWLDDTEDE